MFQAEDGIRDLTVTGVQTCALPISCHASALPAELWPRCRGAELSGGRVLLSTTWGIYPPPGDAQPADTAALSVARRRNPASDVVAGSPRTADSACALA